MLNHFSAYSYFIINIAIMMGYLCARLMMALPFIQRDFSQKNKLNFVKLCFILAIILFFFMPFITKFLSIYPENTALKPVYYHAKKIFLHQQKHIVVPLAQVKSESSRLSFTMILFMLWLVGFLTALYQYIKALLCLQKIKLDAYFRHYTSHIYVLFSSDIHSSFCWSTLNHHYIAIPNAQLANHDDMRLTIRHELQHIRQGDTYWLHFMAIVKLFCFWNPFVKRWINWFNELQEFACDEAVILRKRTSRMAYANCLVNSARSDLLKISVLALNGPSQSILYRRVNMLFSYKNTRKKRSLFLAYCIGFFAILSSAYALNGAPTKSSISAKEITHIIHQSQLDKTFNITVTPELIAEINTMRQNKKTREYMLSSLNRMKDYKPMIEEELKNNNIPSDFLALPLTESGYRPLDASKNRMQAAGIWQFIPSTADHFGLVVSGTRDDRLNTPLETKAAVAYLKSLYEKYHDWNLVLISYEVGDEETARIMNRTKSRKLHDLANASTYPDHLKQYISLFSASLIMMHQPSLITKKI